MSEAGQPRVIIVDDDPDDTYIIKRALAAAALPVCIEVIEDGQSFVDFYCSNTDGSSRFTRQLVLLDVNMPVLSGFDALRTLRTAGALRHTPILMFSTSSEPADVKLAYELGVNGYVKKPSSIEEAERIVTALNAYWLKTNIAALAT